MSAKKTLINNPWLQLLQHIAFWALSFYVFVHVFKIGVQIEKIDFIYTILFHATILPVVYINLSLLLSKSQTELWWRILAIACLILIFSWINYSFFESWSNLILPDYFFISYFSFWQVILFFVVYIAITSLLKLSKSWFSVNELEKELLVAEKQKAEFELKALRAQMNPHFIFNSMNSIKSLIQQNEKNKAIEYLTTFSKLLRSVLQNSDQKAVTLYDEIETCRLYTQLESMRFGKKLCYVFNVDETIDLKSHMVPALIIQPFIENAIWHGIMPKEEGGKLSVIVERNNGSIVCMVDDEGIGREMSKQNKFSPDQSTYQSKGVHLTQSRLDLDNLLNERSAAIEIIDKINEEGKAAGTTVVLKFSEY